MKIAWKHPAYLALVGLFLVFLPFDLPPLHWVQSNHSPWVKFAGHLGSRMGDGWVLVSIGGMLLVAGHWLQRAPLRRAGIESLLAFALSGLTANLVKYLMGRPRPRMMLGGEFLFRPSWDSGFHSFPSGHAATAFAVALVLANHFPRARWFFYAGACLVAVSRVLAGAHFPTDVIVGALLGLFTGNLVIKKEPL